ncbi:Hydrogenase maturation factor [Ekhidna lutea]|uniref:Hydrogenase maturation factor n=1 Tax=Ekhidna lutea TaxID=447679 RepID=A0A239FM25_EKHLU|nr:AIR synthase family protein [Ekhidna lutea]SNS57004.1 Hydrogenase maturation factor [Ekhidna lutea]
MGAFEDQSGKVSAKIFKEDLLEYCGANRKEVVSGPRFGVDTAVIDLGSGEALAVSSDPLSLIPTLGMEVSAWLSVHLLINDMVTTGFAPQYAQFVLNLPVSLTRDQFREYWKYIHQICEKHEIAITGGHTGQIPRQESTISGGGTMFLRAPKDRILSSDGAQPGDSIIVTKEAAVSSTSLLAMAFPETVSEKCSPDVQKKVANNFWNLSVLKDGLVAAKSLQPKAELRAMHDVTEGGILGAINEMAEASGCGFKVDKNKLPVSEEVQKVANLFDIDPFLSIGAGSMILSVKNGMEDQLIADMTKEGIPAVKVGAFTEEPDKCLLAGNDITPFLFDGVDPYWNAFFNALKAGWK